MVKWRIRSFRPAVSARRISSGGDLQDNPASTRPRVRSSSQRPEDRTLSFDVPGPEYMILVMGVTGSGKSSFINLLEDDSVSVGRNLRSHTKSCTAVKTKIGQTIVTVVDTPGFNDDEDSDGKIFAKITRFLSTQYRLGILLKGIIWLQKIDDNKFTGSARRYMDILTQMCGDDASPNIALVTTMWEKVKGTDGLGLGLERDEELRQHYWSTLVDGGSCVFQMYTRSRDRAEAIVATLLKKADVVLQIQRELFDDHQRLDRTCAGKMVSSALEERIFEKLQTIRTLREQLEDAERRKNDRKRDRIRKQLDAQLDEHAIQMRTREELRCQPDDETDEKIKEANDKKEGGWKSRIQLFAGVMGPLVSLAVNLALNFAGA